MLGLSQVSTVQNPQMLETHCVLTQLITWKDTVQLLQVFNFLLNLHHTFISSLRIYVFPNVSYGS